MKYQQCVHFSVIGAIDQTQIVTTVRDFETRLRNITLTGASLIAKAIDSTGLAKEIYKGYMAISGIEVNQGHDIYERLADISINDSVVIPMGQYTPLFIPVLINDVLSFEGVFTVSKSLGNTITIDSYLLLDYEII